MELSEGLGQSNHQTIRNPFSNHGLSLLSPPARKSTRISAQPFTTDACARAANTTCFVTTYPPPPRYHGRKAHAQPPFSTLAFLWTTCGLPTPSNQAQLTALVPSVQSSILGHLAKQTVLMFQILMEMSVVPTCCTPTVVNLRVQLVKTILSVNTECVSLHLRMILRLVSIRLSRSFREEDLGRVIPRLAQRLGSSRVDSEFVIEIPV
jgi:hypothetical protein